MNIIQAYIFVCTCSSIQSET